jgi:hypothetical protein
MNAESDAEKLTWQRKDLQHGVYLIRLTRPSGEAETMRLIVE